MADVQTGSMTWNGVPLLVPDIHGQLQQWLAQFHNIHDVELFCQPQKNTFWGKESLAGTGLCVPSYPALPQPRLNSLIWPNGASRYAYFLGLIPSETPDVAEGDKGSLVLDDGTRKITAKMFVMALRPITVSPNLSLLVLVDQRYLWQDMDGGNIITDNGYDPLETSGDYDGTPNNDYGQLDIGYSEVFASLEERMGVTFTRDTISGFLSCDVLELTNRKYVKAGLLLDAVCESVGLRVICDYDGTIKLWNKNHGYNTNFNNDKNQIAGGKYDSIPVPDAVQVNFPRAAWNYAYPDGDVYTVAIGTSENNRYLTVNSTCYAHFTNTPDNTVNKPDNDANLQNLASNIASAVQGWWQEDYDATFLGIKTWTKSGFDNYVEVNYEIEIPNEEYKIPNDGDKQKHDEKLNLNYYVFTTRAQSLPHECATLINLSQDTDIRFLRGMQWGKISKLGTKATTKNPAQPPQVEIWQYDSKQKAHNTKITIQAWDFLEQNPKVGDDVICTFHTVNRRWYFYKIPSDLQIIQIKDTNSGKDQPANNACLFSSDLVGIDKRYPFCTDSNFSTSTDVWVAIFNNNTNNPQIRNLKPNERFLAKLVGTYTYDDGTNPTDTRPLYVIKKEDFSKVEIVRVQGAPGQPITSNRMCAWDGFILSRQGDYGWCNDNNLPTSDNCWIIDLRTNSTGTSANKTLVGQSKYLGKYLGDWTFGTTKRPLYAIGSTADDAVVVVQLGNTSTTKMLQKNANCMWVGNVVKGNSDQAPCGNGYFQQKNDCWILAMNNDGEVIDWLPNKERYVGVLQGTYAGVGETAGEQVPIYAIHADHHLVRFQLVEPLVYGTTPASNNAMQLRYTPGGNYVQSGNLISVIDYTTNAEGSFSGLGTNELAAGYEGWAEFKPDRDIYEIVWMQQYANWIRFYSASGMAPTDESGTAYIIEYWQGRNPAPGNGRITVYNMPLGNTGGAFRVVPNANALATYDAKAGKYKIVWAQCRPSNICGTLAGPLTGGTAMGNITYAWDCKNRPFDFAAGNQATLRDKSSIFSGIKGNKYQASYDIMADEYILTWVECSSGS